MGKCATCKYWYGTKFSNWSDCYRVVAALEPKLLTVYREVFNDDGDCVNIIKFTVPFDPHHFINWRKEPDFITLYKKIKELPPGVRRDKQYFQTHKDFECEHYKEK